MINLIIGFITGSIFTLCAPKLWQIAKKFMTKQLDDLEDKVS